MLPLRHGQAEGRIGIKEFTDLDVTIHVDVKIRGLGTINNSLLERRGVNTKHVGSCWHFGSRSFIASWKFHI